MNTVTKIMTLFVITAFVLLHQSCVKNACTKTYTYEYYQPLYKPVSEVKANIKSNAPRSINKPGKIYLKGNYIFLNEIDKGIHVIDNSNPAAPVNISFIDLPGNVDIAVKNNTLYADFYTSLVVMDISNPLNIVVKKFVNNVFPERYYYGYNIDSSGVIYDWVKKTETITRDCNTIYPDVYMGGVVMDAMDAGFSSTNKSSTPVGISGSLARFALIGNYMYAVSTDSLKVIDVSSDEDPSVANSIGLGWGIETIFPFKDKLFIGSNDGMFIYSVQNPTGPLKQGNFNHLRTCDPVIADNNYAYVTLHSGSQCAGFENQLDVLDIADLQSPQLIKTYQLTNPRGLSKDGDLLFICDGSDGLKVFTAADPKAITLRKQFVLPESNDVIACNNIALVISDDGLYQFDYSDKDNIKLISKITVQN